MQAGVSSVPVAAEVQAGMLSYQELATSLAKNSFQSSVRPPSQQQAFADMLKQKARIDAVDSRVAATQQALDSAEETVSAAEGGLAKLQEKIGSLKLEMSEKRAAHPPAPARLGKLERCEPQVQ